MKLEIKRFGEDYYNHDIGCIGGELETKRTIKKLLSKARRNEDRIVIKDSIETN